MSGLVRESLYKGGEYLADQSGAGGVLTFTFSEEHQLVWVQIDGGDGRADPFGGTPSASAGIPCVDGTPQPMTVSTDVVKVFAPGSTTVHVWGYRINA